MPIKSSKGYKKKCDDLAGKITRSVGKCDNCGSDQWLTTSHIIGRRYSATRTDLDNLQCLCAKCHRRFTDFPVEFREWIMKTIGEVEYERLRIKAESFRGKFNWELEYERLKDLI